VNTKRWASILIACVAAIAVLSGCTSGAQKHSSTSAVQTHTPDFPAAPTTKQPVAPTPGSKHDIHRHPNAEEFEYLVSGRGIARVGDADVELGPGEVVFVPKNDYHGFENTGDEPVFMIWGYAGAASLDEAGYIRYVDDHPG